jgi:predicted TIM-barrel fold metal-dependent hydrolase
MTLAASSSLTTPNLPKEFVDAHHHFVDTETNGSTFQAFLGRLIPSGVVYLPDDYRRDVIEPLEKAGVKFGGSVHVEAIPDNGFQEARWVAGWIRSDSSSPPSNVRAIVASCDLAQDAALVECELERLTTEIPMVRGIRWILDCVGRFEDGNTATHVATTRHDGIDYLRGSEGGYDGHAVPAFERGFALLGRFNLTFDLQCAPAQLPEASELCSRHPNIRVVIDHLGKPRTLLGPDVTDNHTTQPNESELACWRKGMNRMARNPNVYVKISMLGYVIPGWIRTEERVALMKSLVLETVELFGPDRCMVATNFWKDAATSDSDCMSDVAPDPIRYIELIYGFLRDNYSEEDLDKIFSKTASTFYGFN